MPTEKETYVIEDHLCVCGGRVLRRVGSYMSTGADFRCTDCGEVKSGHGPDVLCWCGQKHKQNNMTAYRCLPFSILETQPWSKELFLECGCDPKRGEVGIVIEKRYHEMFAKMPKP